MSRRRRPTIEAPALGAVVEPIAEAEDVAAVLVGRYRPRLGEFHGVDAQGRARPLPKRTV